MYNLDPDFRFEHDLYYMALAIQNKDGMNLIIERAEDVWEATLEVSGQEYVFQDKYVSDLFRAVMSKIERVGKDLGWRQDIRATRR